MLVKLSLRNVKRSFSDYAIYFLTLTFGVSLFYSFNSIQAQQAILDLSSIQKEFIDYLMISLSFISLFISFVFAFLILYANQFLVKRRKKELGLYQTLGMSKGAISRLFVMETFFIGLASLGSGLVLGTFLSQGFSVLVSSLFEVEILQYEFVFSSSAMIQTVIYFTIIFVVVMIFNTIIIARFKLIDLLYGSQKNESIKVRNPKMNAVLFIISALLLISSYFGFAKFGIRMGIIPLIISSTCAIFGTFLWFFSLTGFLLQRIQNNKNVYFKDLTMFVLRQINSKINTNFISMAIICFMLTGTITVLAGGFGYKKAMDEELKLVTPYDVTFKTWLWDEQRPEKPNEIERILKENNVTLQELGDYTAFHLYNPQLNVSLLMAPYVSNREYAMFFGDGTSNTVFALKQSDYEKLATMQGIKPISMKENEVVLFTGFQNMVQGFQSWINQSPQITVAGKEYKIANEKMQLLTIENTEVPRDKLFVVLPDKDVAKLDVQGEQVVANYTTKVQQTNEKLMKLFNDMTAPGRGGADYVLPYTKTYVYESSLGYTGTLIFVGIYVGLIFLVSSAAILTLQQLSEASDNLARYRTLKRIGATQQSIHRVIFQQIFIYFMLPLSLALIHSAFIIRMINEVASSTADWSIAIPALGTGVILLFVYGGYFFATYKGYKTIVK